MTFGQHLRCVNCSLCISNSFLGMCSLTWKAWKWSWKKVSYSIKTKTTWLLCKMIEAILLKSGEFSSVPVRTKSPTRYSTPQHFTYFVRLTVACGSTWRYDFTSSVNSSVSSKHILTGPDSTDFEAKHSQRYATENWCLFASDKVKFLKFFTQSLKNVCFASNLMVHIWMSGPIFLMHLG